MVGLQNLTGRVAKIEAAYDFNKALLTHRLEVPCSIPRSGKEIISKFHNFFVLSKDTKIGKLT